MTISLRTQFSPFNASRVFIVGWASVICALLYLDIPLNNAAPVAAILVIQASLGAALLIRLIGLVNPSLLLFCGPGLILGSSLNFALFQIFGRGVTGFIVSTSLSAVGSALALSTISVSNIRISNWSMPAYISALAALAMSAEFKWLLVVAPILFVAGSMLPLLPRLGKISSSAISFSLLTLLLIAQRIRGRWWWLVTDDYKFFQVLAQHLTVEGPFADWGVLDFSRYHWLSYGWSGLLELVALRSEPLMILTRVMPLAYSVALAASLILVAEFVAPRAATFPARFLPVAVVVAAFPLDWTGTSTAGAISVLAAFLSVMCAMLEFRSSPVKRLLAYLAFGTIAILTKLPSSLMVVPLAAAVEVTIFARSRRRIQARAALISSVALAGLVVLFLLPSLSNLVGSFTLQWGRQRGDDLSQHGLVASIIIVAGRRTWQLVMIVASWALYRTCSRSEKVSDSGRLVFSLAPLLVVGAVMDAIVVGTANTNEYFSQPSYFLAGVAVIGVSGWFARQRTRGPRSSEILGWAAVAFATALFGFILQRVPLPRLPALATIGKTAGDIRILFGVVLVLWHIRTKRRTEQRGFVPTLLMMGVLMFSSLYPSISAVVTKGFGPTPSRIDLLSMLGPPDAETIGRWIEHNTSSDDLIATNYLTNGNDDLGFDYSLAMWSRREFLTYDSFLSFDTSRQEVQSSDIEDFAVSASAKSADYLRAEGVKWYVVDLATTSRRSWEPHAEVVAMTWRLWVLRLH